MHTTSTGMHKNEQIFVCLCERRKSWQMAYLLLRMEIVNKETSYKYMLPFSSYTVHND